MAAKQQKLVRQGDVLLVPVDRVPAGARDVTPADRVVLAEGEATGHAHVVEGGGARLLSWRERQPARFRPGTPVLTYLTVPAGSSALLVHEEHDAIPIASGLYEVRRQREYLPGRASRRVAD